MLFVFILDGHYALISGISTSRADLHDFTTVANAVAAPEDSLDEVEVKSSDEAAGGRGGLDHEATVVAVIIAVSTSVVVLTLLAAAIGTVYCKRARVSEDTEIVPSSTLFANKIDLFVNKLCCPIAQSTWNFNRNSTNTKCS